MLNNLGRTVVLARERLGAGRVGHGRSGVGPGRRFRGWHSGVGAGCAGAQRALQRRRLDERRGHRQRPLDAAAGRLSGIIDFGMAGLGDPATDLGHLLQIYGESFVRRILGHYPEAVGLMPRARFYAEAIDLDWTLSSLASGDKCWFTAHLGGARDLFRDDDFGVKT